MKGIKTISKKKETEKFQIQLQTLKNILFFFLSKAKNILTSSTDNKFRDLKFRKTVIASYAVKSVLTGAKNNIYMKK